MKGTTLVLPTSEYEALRAGAFDELPRVVPIGRALVSRVVRRRFCKALMLAKRDVTQEPYFRSAPLNEAKT